MVTDVSSYSEIFAKPNETLENHTDKAIHFLLKYFKWQRGNIEKVANIAGIDGNEPRNGIPKAPTAPISSTTGRTTLSPKFSPSYKDDEEI